VLIIASVLSIWVIFFRDDESKLEENLLVDTYDISKNYLALRYRTDYLLTQAEVILIMKIGIKN
jgi:hypothetical protein